MFFIGSFFVVVFNLYWILTLFFDNFPLILLKSGIPFLFGLFPYFCLVRFLSAILAVYLLAISLFPCSDRGHNPLPTTQTSIVAATQTTATHQHRDACSPFCSCSCCGINILVPAPVILYTFSDQLYSNTPIWRYGLLLSEAIDFWQPPKIA